MKRILILLFIVSMAYAATAEIVTHDAGKAVEHYLAGMEAAEKKDHAAYEQSMRAALDAAPGHPVLMRHLARALATQGRGDDAVAWLHKVALTGVDLGVADDETFAALRERVDFQAVLAEIDERRSIIGDAEVAFTLDAGDMLPEGIAYDPFEEVFYIGSIRHGNIIRVSTTGTWEEFIAPDDLEGALGLRVDNERRNLWVVSAVMPGVEGYTEARNGNAAVHCIDLDACVVTNRIHLPRVGDLTYNLNDIVIAPDGTAYITESIQGGIYRVAPRGDRLEEFIPPGELRGPNGIAISADGRLLYVAQYVWVIAVVDIDTRAWRPLPHPDDVAPYGIDGLYFHKSALVGIQNYAGLEHVTRFDLSGNGRAIVGSRILSRHHPRCEDPTTGAFRGDDFYVIANSQLPKIDADGGVPSADAFDETFILKLTVE